MAYNSSPGRAEYVATAAQTNFPFSFKIFSETDIKVYQTPVGDAPNDTNDILTYITDYAVTINGDLGGEIVLVSGATVGDALTLVRDLPIDRTIEYQTSGDLLASTLNTDLNYNTYLTADREQVSSRYVSIPVSAQNVSTELPDVSGDAYIKWNTTGDALENDLTLPQSVVTTNANVVAAQLAQDGAETAETNAGNSATDAQLRAWEAEAEELTAQSNANEAENVFTKTYTSNGDGTFSSVNNAWYSAYHYAQKAISGGTERTSARNTAISASASGVLALATTPTASFATVIYTGNGTSHDIVTNLKSYDPNWVSGRAYLLANEQDAYCIHNYYIYKLLADVTSATTPDADPTNWEVVADGVSVPWFNSQAWIKDRDLATSHYIYDSLRGVEAALSSDTTAIESTLDGVTSFNSDGVTIGTAHNGTHGYVAWQEQFDTMVSGVTNHGKRYITASNAQSGKFMGIMVGSGTAGHEIPHGVGTKPDFFVTKGRNSTTNWGAYNSPEGATKYMLLNTNGASAASITLWNDTEPTDSVFTVGTNSAVNILNENYVFYGSSNRDNHTVTKMYQGTGAAGNVVPLGLDMTQAGAKVMIKALSGVGSWLLKDGTRGATNTVFADLSNAEDTTSYTADFTNNGIVINNALAPMNASGVTYLIEAVVPNYDKPTGGLDIPAGTVISYAEGTDGTTGDLDSIETTTLHSDLTMTANAKNYIYLDKGNVASTSIYPLLKQLDSTLDANSPIYNVGEGEVYDTAGVQKSRVILGEVIADGEGLVIPDTLVEYPVAHQDVTSMEVHEGLVVHGGFDLGQAWVDETANRLVGVTYKNETGKPIMVALKTINTTSPTAAWGYVDGIAIVANYSGSTATKRSGCTFIVPNGSTYNTTNTLNLDTWMEYK